MKKVSTWLASIVAVFCLIATSNLAVSQLVPFKASGDGAIYSPDEFTTSGFGNATHMGKVLGEGVAVPGDAVDEELFPGLFYWTATDYCFTNRKGDKLIMCGGGVVQFIPIDPDDPFETDFFAIWSGEFYIKSGEGRLRDVKPSVEPILVTAVNDPFELQGFGDPNPGEPIPGDTWTYSWELDGKIDLGKKGKKAK